VVAGLGLLGRGIAACFLGHGFEVVAIDRDEARHGEARKQIAVMVGELVDLGGFPSRLRDEWEGPLLRAKRLLTRLKIVLLPLKV